MKPGKMLQLLVMFSVMIAAVLSVTYQVGAVNEKYNRVAFRGTPVVDGDINDKVWQSADRKSVV